MRFRLIADMVLRLPVPLAGNDPHNLIDCRELIGMDAYDLSPVLDEAYTFAD